MNDVVFQIGSVFPDLWGACWEVVPHAIKKGNHRWSVVNLMSGSEMDWTGYIKPETKVLYYPNTYYAIEERNYDYLIPIADNINTEIAAGHKVIVHCRQGIDRTSYVLGTYMLKFRPSEEGLSTTGMKNKIIDDLRRDYNEHSFRNEEFTKSFMLIPEVL